MLLGALTKQMDGFNLFSPRPVIPFLGYSANAVAESIRSVMTPDWCLSNRKPHRCNLHDLMNPVVGSFQADMEEVASEQYYLMLF